MSLHSSPDNLSLDQLRRKAGNFDAAALCLILGAVACGVSAVAQSQTSLLSSGTGTASLAVLIAWALIAVVLGAVGASLFAVGLLLHTLTESAHVEHLATEE